MNNTDTARQWLLTKSNGSNYIACDGMDSIIPPKEVMTRGSFIPAFYNLRSKGEIETDVTVTPGGRKFLKGVKLLKMPSATTIIKNDAEKLKTTTKPKTIELKASMTLPNLITYYKKKNVVASIMQQLKDNGFDESEASITFEPNPIAEEALALLDLVERAQKTLNTLSEENHKLKLDLQAEKQINERYSKMLKLDAKDYIEPNAAGTKG